MKLGGRKMDTPPHTQNIRGWKFRDHPFQLSLPLPLFEIESYAVQAGLTLLCH